MSRAGLSSSRSPSSRSPSSRRPFSRPGAARLRVWGPALVVALAVGAAVAISGQLMLQAGMRYSLDVLTRSVDSGAGAVGQAVAGQFQRALDLGIPLDRIPDAEAYLARVAADSPQVRGLALIDGEGRVIAASGPDIVAAPHPAATYPEAAELIDLDDPLRRTRLMVYAASPFFGEAILRLRVALGLAAVLAGLTAGAVTAGFLGLAQEPARRRLRRALEHAAEGDFAQADPGRARGRFGAAARALARQVETVSAARLKLDEAVATIRAIDFDGSLSRRIEPITAPLAARYALPAQPDPFAEDPAEAETPAPLRGDAGDAGVWRPALAAAFCTAAFPLAANFALDRGAFAVPPAWAPAIPAMVELAALVLGAALGLTRLGAARAMRALGLILLGLCLAATFWCRDYDLFLALRLGAGFGAGLATAGLLRGAAPFAAPRGARAALIFAALVAAPLLAGLLGEAVGRRAAFLTLGLCVLALTLPLSLGGRPPAAAAAAPAPSTGERGREPGARLLLALAAAPAAALLAVRIPLGVGYDDYLSGGDAAAAFGLAALIAPRRPWIPGPALIAAAAVLSFAPQTAVFAAAACALLGLGFGAALPLRPGRGALAALALGLMAGLVAAGLCARHGLPDATVPAVSGALALLCALAGLSRGPARARIDRARLQHPPRGG